MKAAILVVLSGLVGFAALTGWALESGGVAVLETRAPDGSPRETRVWFVATEGGLWLEAGTPENPWYLDVQQDPMVRLTASRGPGPSGHYVARPVPGREAHREIRQLLREKYGARDRWVTLLFDTSRSVAVQLVPLPTVGAAGDGRS